jgi:hypothetical protein
MPVTFTGGHYPYTTIVEDAHGDLHVFKGQVTPSNHPTLPKVLNQEADLFIQSEACKEDILSALPEDEVMHLKLGYSIQTKFISDEYFTEY